jgi:iron complex transport system ATP-binding protein
MIRANGITVQRGDRTILNNVSVDLAAGSFVAVIGGNGAGKSTLLSVLAGLLRPNAGSIALDGTPLMMLDRRTLATRRAYLPQSPRAEWPISVERLVALGLLPRLPGFGPLPVALSVRIDAALRRCDLAERRNQPVTTLSGGELARAMLARALVGDPDVLIADEPLAGLDPGHAIDGMARLGELAASGKLVVASLHDLTLTARHASHVVALRDGNLIAAGRTPDVLTPSLIRKIFDVTAHVEGTGEQTYVNIVGREADLTLPGSAVIT